MTIERQSHRIERPFLVMATQNPIESEGTYNLPEAQLDRFMFKLVVNYPSAAEEAEILAMHSVQVDLDSRLEKLETLTGPAEIVEITAAVRPGAGGPEAVGLHQRAGAADAAVAAVLPGGFAPGGDRADAGASARWPPSAAATTPCRTTWSSWPCPRCATA